MEIKSQFSEVHQFSRLILLMAKTVNRSRLKKTSGVSCFRAWTWISYFIAWISWP